MDITIASFDAISEVNMVSISFLPHFRVDFAELPQTDPIIFFLLLLSSFDSAFNGPPGLHANIVPQPVQYSLS